MANTAQARKRARQAEVRRQHNASLKSSLRTALKKVKKAIAGGVITSDADMAKINYANVTNGMNPKIRTSWLNGNYLNPQDPDNVNATPGDVRLDRQWFTVNAAPSDQYTLAVPGSDQYRLAPNQSGFANLYLCGDWTNFGCGQAIVIDGDLLLGGADPRMDGSAAPA